MERIYDDVPRYETREATTVTRREEPTVPRGGVDRYETRGETTTTVTRRDQEAPTSRYEPAFSPGLGGLPSTTRYEGNVAREHRYDDREPTTTVTSRRDEPTRGVDRYDTSPTVTRGGVERYETTTTTSTSRRQEDVSGRTGYEARDPFGDATVTEHRYDAREPTTVTSRRDEPTVTRREETTVTRREEQVPRTETRWEEPEREVQGARADFIRHIDPVYDHPPRESGQFDERFVVSVL